MMKPYIFLLSFYLSTSYMFSQNYVDVLKVSGSTTSLNKFDSSTTKTRISEVVADLTVPIRISDRLSLFSGFIYENIRVKLFAEEGTKHFGSTLIKLGASKQFNERWSGTLALLPKMASDYKTFENKDFQLGALATFKYKKRSDLNYKFGVYYNSELFGPFFVPMLGLYYLSPDKKFEVNAMLPLQADLNYKLQPMLNVGFNFNGQIRSYHLTRNTSDQRSDYVVKSTNEFFLYLQWKVSSGFSIQTKAGYSVGRSYRVYDTNDKVTFGLPATFIGAKRNQLNSDFSDGAIFQLVLLYRFHLEKN